MDKKATTANQTQASAMTKNASFSKTVSRMLGLSLQGWENVMIASLCIAALFAAVVGVSTYCVVQLQREQITASKNEFETYKLDAAERISAANSASDAAKADAEASRTEQERLKSQLTWRRVTREQVTTFFEAFRNENKSDKRFGAINLVWPGSDPEAAVYANDFVLLLGVAGSALPQPLVENGYIPFPFGISVFGPSAATEQLELLKGALEKTGISFKADPWPTLNRYIIADGPVVVIGHKPPPF
jgi:hypothetical protein